MNSPYPDNMGPEEWLPGVDPLILPFTFKIMDIAHAAYRREKYWDKASCSQFGESEKRNFHRVLRRVYMSQGWQGVTDAVDAVEAALMLGGKKEDRDDRARFVIDVLLRCLDP